MIISYILFSLGFIAVVSWWVYNKWFNPNPLTLNDLLIKNVESTFKALGAGGTVLEVINLSLVSMQNNGTDPFQAFGRNLLAGVMEVLLTWMFIGVISKSLKKASDDGKITIKEYIIIVIKALPSFIFGYLMTSQIHNFYLESIYHIEIQQKAPLVSWLPLTGFHMETNPSNFDLIDPAWRQQINYVTLIMIYCTPVFNLMMVYFMWIKVKDEMDEMNNKFDSLESNEKETSDNNITETKEESKVQTNGLEYYFDSIKNWFGVSENDIVSWLSNYIGSDIITGKTIKHNITDKDILSGVIKPQDLLIEVTEKLIGSQKGNTHTGLCGIKKATDDISAMITKYKALEEEINNRKDQRTDNRKKGISVGDLNVEINQYEADLRDLKDDIMEELSHRNGLKRGVINLFKGLNFNKISDNFIDSFDTEVKSAFN